MTTGLKRLTPIASAMMALAAIACCLPVGFLGATALVTLAGMMAAYQGWFLAGAGVLLAIASWQAFRGTKSCRRRGSFFGLAVLAFSAAVVVGIFAFPQYTAGVIADGQILSHGSGTAPVLTDIASAADLRSQFNRAASTTRVILLMAPSCPTCLEGAAEVERVLERHRDAKVTVFAVWNPILPTDWGRPGEHDRFRLTDGRVVHLWDPNHFVSRELQRTGEREHMELDCCDRKGIWWDFLAVFPAAARWDDSLPKPELMSGVIADAAPNMERLLLSQLSGVSSR